MRALVALIVLAAATAPPTSALPDPAGGAASIGPPSDARLATIGYGADGVEAWRGRVEPVSWAPRAVVLHGFLTAAECDHLIAKAKPRMEVSTVVDNDSGQSMPSKVRTSTGTFFELGEDPVIEAIERRIALVTNLPVDNGEGLQILRYVDGQKYEPHHDFFHDDFNTKAENGGQRIATVLMYLSTPEKGGETVFPKGLPRATGPAYSECAQEGMAVKPSKGDALLFYSLNPKGERDWNSLHGSCPVLAGDKWSATKWIHVTKFYQTEGAADGAADGGGCDDASEHCAAWAAAGECKANPGYMMVSCRKACGACPPPLPGSA